MKQLQKNKALRTELLGLLVDFCRIIPCNLHDEIFSSVQALMSICQPWFARDHISALLSSLMDKYTMRSKSYKNLLSSFIMVVVRLSHAKLMRSHRKEELIKFVQAEIQCNQELFTRLIRQRPARPEEPVQDELVSTSQDDLDNYVYEDRESGTHVLDDDIEIQYNEADRYHDFRQ